MQPILMVRCSAFFFFFLWNVYGGFSAFAAETAMALTLKQLSEAGSIEKAFLLYHDREIKVSGFLYRDQAGHWILSSEPNLKTCCVGTARKMWEQIIVAGNIEETAKGQVYALEGKLVVDPLWQDSELKRIYRLDEARIVSDSKSFSGMILSGIIGCLIAGGVILRRKKNKTQVKSTQSGQEATRWIGNPKNS
jgi:hypothetical protein